MDVGALDRRVHVEAPSATRDSYGATIPGWTTIATVWGNVIPVTGTERAALGSQIASAYFRVLVRYRTDIDTTARITIDGSKVALVRNVIELGRRDWLELFCEQSL